MCSQAKHGGRGMWTLSVSMLKEINSKESDKYFVFNITVTSLTEDCTPFSSSTNKKEVSTPDAKA